MTEGWKTYRLEDLCSIEIGRTPARDDPRLWDRNRSGDNVWLSIADLARQVDGVVSDSREYVSDQGAALCKLVPAGTLLLSFKLTLGRLAVAGRPVYTNEAIAALSLRRPRLLERSYLRFFLEAFDWEKASEGDHKVKGRALNKAKLKGISVLVPPLFEQRRIVAILNEAFEAIATAKANTEKSLQNAREWVEIQMSAMLDAASESGHSAALATLVTSGCTLSYGIVQPGSDFSGGVPVVRPVDLGGRTVSAEGLKRIDPALARSYARTILEGGDLLLCVRGTTGTVSTAEMGLAGANVTRGIVPIRFDPRVIAQSFGYYLLRSQPVQAQIREKTYGAALMQINIGDLRKIAIAFPPLEKQDGLVNQLDSIQAAADQLVESYEQKLTALDELKNSLLHQAFIGVLSAKTTERELEAMA